MARHYSTAFKQEAIRLLATGMPVGEAAHVLEMPPMTLWGWYYRAKAEDRAGGGGLFLQHGTGSGGPGRRRPAAPAPGGAAGRAGGRAGDPGKVSAFAKQRQT